MRRQGGINRAGAAGEASAEVPPAAGETDRAGADEAAADAQPGLELLAASKPEEHDGSKENVPGALVC